MSTNRPPSCDLPPEFYQKKPMMKPCPFCGSEDIVNASMLFKTQFIACNQCGLDGPQGKESDGSAIIKWNSIPRRSEVLELLRLVDEVTVFGRALIDTRNFPDAGSFMVKHLEQLKAYANKLRKEMGE